MAYALFHRMLQRCSSSTFGYGAANNHFGDTVTLCEHIVTSPLDSYPDREWYWLIAASGTDIVVPNWLI